MDHLLERNDDNAMLPALFSRPSAQRSGRPSSLIVLTTRAICKKPITLHRFFHPVPLPHSGARQSARFAGRCRE